MNGHSPAAPRGASRNRSLTPPPASGAKARKPTRLARIESAGWAETPEPTRAIFDDMTAKLERRGVEIVGRADDPDLEAYERDLIKLREVMDVILTFEGRWPLMMYADRNPDLLGERVFNRAKAANDVTPAQYEEALDWSAGARTRHEALATKYDALITLNATGPAPEGMPVGNAVYGEQSSVLGVPALNVPLLAQDGMPLGIQLLGYFRRDYELIALGHWMIHAVLREED